MTKSFHVGIFSFADLATQQCLVAGRHHRRLHVVEVDFNASVADTPHHLNGMPCIVPRSAVRCFRGNLLTRSAVDDEDLVGVIVGLLAEVDVVEMAGVLVAEE
jgi:hypothetical protein